jgi:alpha,alpha-trehalase
VRMKDGTVLNRYWDDRCTPREESWREDVATAAQSGRDVQEVYRHLRAAAESGWDFSTRWFEENEEGQLASSLETIRTTDILPVDLNVFMHALEYCIARLAKATGDERTREHFAALASSRAEAIRRVFWDADACCFVDYDWRQDRRRHCLTGASVVPLYCRVASQEQADAMAATVRARLLAPGGFGTSECGSEEQWDRPNGWAPLQWMAVQGFDAYGQSDLASEIRNRWLATVSEVYAREGKLVEKYALRTSAAYPARGGGGGEYPLQDGFGWTNGVTRRWLHEEARKDSSQPA